VRFAVEVPVRWSDMDAYGHVNHARTVTLLEEARTELLFNEMPRRGLGQVSNGIVVYRLSVDYLAPIMHGVGPVFVDMWVTDVRAASFVLHYSVRGGDDRRPLATASTTMVPYDFAAGRPRRLSRNEQAFLMLWTDSASDDTSDTPDALDALDEDAASA